ncbi:uncharacterized protein PSANT_04812 [Moesziomyces antarcticus]|nr:uncharacterized protein PSANT_04812 [Moesziomyces antarcticus]
MSATLHSHPYRLSPSVSLAVDGADTSLQHSQSNASNLFQHGLLARSPQSSNAARLSPLPQATSPTSPVASSSRTTMATASSSPQPKPAAALGSELFDAIVQAADPRHPDHAAWQERYGSLSNRSSRASFSSSSKRDKAGPNLAATSNSRKSLDHPDGATRRRGASRKAGAPFDLSRSNHADSAAGSDADDPLLPAFLSGDDRSTPVRASFEGSMHSNRSASVASSSHRRRNRRLRDASRPKPLLPPIPPPRVTSSTNWQSTYGSPSLPTLASSSRIDNHPSSSGTVSDNQDHFAFPAPAERLLASPDLPASVRIAHPYASAMAAEPALEKVSALPTMPFAPFANGINPIGRPRQHPASSELSISANQSPALSLPAADQREPVRPSHTGHQRRQESTSTSGHSSQVGAMPAFASHTSPNGALTQQSSFLHLPRSKSASKQVASPRIGHTTLPDRPSRHANRPDGIAPPRKSLSKIRQILGSDTPALDGPPLPEKSQAQLQRAANSANEIQDAAPSLPPKGGSWAAAPPQEAATRTPQPAQAGQDAEVSREGVDSSSKFGLAAFPLRRDDEFRANDNEFEMSDDSDVEPEPEVSRVGLPQLSTSSFHHQHATAPRKPQRNPGAVRRSLDSIISPFRAGLFNVGGGSSSTGRKSNASNTKAGLAVPEPEPIAEGRRSFSDSRFVRPFLPRNRNATLNGNRRPLSKVLDHPDDEIEDVMQVLARRQGDEHDASLGMSPAADAQAASTDAHAKSDLQSVEFSSRRNRAINFDLPNSKRVPTGPSAGGHGNANGAEAGQRSWEATAAPGWADASMPSMSSSRSMASTFSRSTNNLHDGGDSPFEAFARNATLSIQQQSPRGRFGGFFSKVKGSVTPKGTPNLPSNEFSASSGPSTINHQQNDSPQASPVAMIGTSKRAERPFRARVKSLTSPRGLSSSRNNDNAAIVPAVPAIPSQFVDLPTEDDRYVRAASVGPTLTNSSTASSQAMQMPASMSATFASPGWEHTQSVWEESPQIPTSSTFPSTDKSSRSLGRLLRRKKTQENLDAVIESFVPLPPKMSHADAADEAAPRSSMSSVRGFDVVDPAEPASSLGQTRTTIRKTLSPALLSDSPHQGIDEALEDEVASSLGHGVAGARLDVDADVRKGSEAAAARETSEADDVAEELSELPGDSQRFRSPLGRFIRSNAPGDRLSRVEELSERLSHIADPTDTGALRGPVSLPTSPNPRSFGEHRSVRRSVSGNVRGQAVPPPTLELAGVRESRLRNASLDIVRNGTAYEAASSRPAALESPASLGSTVASSPAAGRSAMTPKSPGSMAMFGEQLTPSWRSTSFSTARTGRTSFSQDRDRAPVASPISPPMPSSRGAGVSQAIKRLGIKGKSKKTGKGIGPSDVIVLDYDEDETAEDALREAAARPSMSLEPRPSFGGGARPSFSNLARPSFGGGARPSIEVTGRNSLVAAEMVTKLLEVEASGLIPSPVTPSFGSNGLGQHSQSDFAKSTTSLGRKGAESDAGLGAAEVAGLGIGSVQWCEGMPLHKAESGEAMASASASDGTYTSQGVQTPENASLSHSASMQMLPKSDMAWAGTDGDTDATPSTPGLPPPKSSELVALEALLGRFPQQQKELLQDISARVAKTPKMDKRGGWDSREDVASS